MSKPIKVTLTMDPDTARSVLNILEHAIAQGDQRLELDKDRFDKSAVEFHERTKDQLQRQVLEPIRACFPPKAYCECHPSPDRPTYHFRPCSKGLTEGYKPT